jgi:thiosulfate reductase / polysulfide reductase chain A
VPFQDGDTANPISFADTICPEALIGISGERTNRFTHTQFHNIPWLTQGEKAGTADLHPEDASARNITAGQWLTLSSPRGVMRMEARISEAVHPGVVRIAWGWGEVDPEANVNNLTDDDRRNPVTGTPSNRSFICRIES